MARVVVRAFGVSLDGYGAGPDQSLKSPLGVGGEGLHEWFFPTRTFQSMLGKEGGTTGVDDDFAVRGFHNIGSWIIGRNMFSPWRGEWTEEWKGWWGEKPPYHCDVFVLTHYPRDPLPMAGGTTFHFVTGGMEEALDRALKAADGKDVRIGGGVATVRQYVQAGVVDEIHLALSPVLLGSGEPLFAGLDLKALGYRCVERVATGAATHVVLAREGR